MTSIKSLTIPAMISKWDTLWPALKFNNSCYDIKRISAVQKELILSLGRACFSSLDSANTFDTSVKLSILIAGFAIIQKNVWVQTLAYINLYKSPLTYRQLTQ